MLHPNNRANTIISQSFIANEFQGFSDPFTKTEPTSSLNQFVRSKQTSDSGIIQDGENHSFGFGNITASSEPKQLESFSRKANEPVQVNATSVGESRNRARLQSYDDDNGQNTQASKQQQFQTMQVPQQFNQRYVSPNVVKTDSPTKPGQFAQQRTSQQFGNMQPVYNQPPQQGNAFNQQQSTQAFSSQGSRTEGFSHSRAESFSTQNQYSQQQLNSSQLGSSDFGGRRASGQQSLQGSSVGKRFKLNVSQEFSNSFVLKCVNQPQKSSILSMKQRQREFRKSIQNFFI